MRVCFGQLELLLPGKQLLRKLKLSSFHGPDWRAAKCSVLINDVAGAFVGLMQLGTEPAIFTVVTGSVERSAFHLTDVGRVHKGHNPDEECFAIS